MKASSRKPLTAIVREASERWITGGLPSGRAARLRRISWVTPTTWMTNAVSRSTRKTQSSPSSGIDRTADVAQELGVLVDRGGAAVAGPCSAFRLPSACRIT